MLGKLLKYEIKSTARTFLPFFVAILGLSIVNKISMMFFANFDFMNIPKFVLMTTYILMTAAAFVMCIIVTIQRFYKNLLGNEGYLMFTLPVSTTANILSKAITAFLWIAATALVTLFSIFVMIPEYGWIKDIPPAWASVAAEFQSIFGISLNLLVVLFCVVSIISVILFIFEIYLAISIGQLSNNHKLLASFGTYVGLYMVGQIISMVAMSIIGLNFFKTTATAVDGMHMMLLLLIYALVMGCVLAVVYFFLSRYLLGKRLNLE